MVLAAVAAVIAAASLLLALVQVAGVVKRLWPSRRA
jgi:hypothetical protein